MIFAPPALPLSRAVANVRFCMYKYYYQLFILNLAVFHNEEFVVTNYSTYNYFHHDLN